MAHKLEGKNHQKDVLLKCISKIDKVRRKELDEIADNQLRKTVDGHLTKARNLLMKEVNDKYLV